MIAWARSGWIGVGLGLGLLACTPPTDPGDPQDGGEDFSLGEPRTCDDPAEGLERLADEAQERGFAVDLQPADTPSPCRGFLRQLVVQDMDGDGDLDILVSRTEAFPHLFENDGSGRFVERTPDLPVQAVFGRPVSAISAVDIDGDGLPELYAGGEGFVAVARNEGDLSFAPFESVWFQEGYPRDCLFSFVAGDVDEDDDLDLVLAGFVHVPDEDFDDGDGPPAHPQGGVDRVLLMEDGAPVEELVVQVEGGAYSFTMVAALTDRDADGDLDMLFGAERGDTGAPPLLFYRNDGLDAEGLPRFVDDAPELNADISIAAMGYDAADLNGDGVLDHCMTDDRIHCLVSDGSGAYFEGGVALGGVPDIESHPDWADPPGWFWSGWSMELSDLDNDGALDLAAVAGAPPGIEVNPFQPNALWMGDGLGGFEARSQELGFHSAGTDYGLVAADLDGDGSPELVSAPADGQPSLWTAGCSSGAWLDLELRGLDGNSEGFGARVVLQAGGSRQIREVHGLRALAQGPSMLHFGLGEVSSVERLEVHWPDGSLSSLEDFEARRLVTVSHPDLQR